MVKERGPLPHVSIGAVVRGGERRADAAAVQPDEGGTQQLGRQLGTGIVPGQGKPRASKVFFIF
jgi:hypothetical protein